MVGDVGSGEMFFFFVLVSRFSMILVGIVVV